MTLSRLLAVGLMLVTAALPARPLVAESSSALVQQPALSGVVRDEVGDPVVDVEVVALRLGADRRQYEIHGRARTDDRGQYRIAPFTVGPTAGGTYLIRVHGSGGSRQASLAAQTIVTFPVMYYPAASGPSTAVPIELGPGEQRPGIDFTLPQARGVRVAGTVHDRHALRATSLQLSLLQMDNGELMWDLPVASVRVPPDGRFSFSRVPAGTYTLWAVSFPLHTDRPTATVRDVSATSVLGVRSTVSRRGRGPLGPPPSGDTYWIKETVVVGTDDLDVALRFSRGTRLSGQVVFDGTSARPSAEELERTAVRILAVDGADLGTVPLSGLDADGRFSVVAVPPGNYELELQWPRYAGWQLRSLTVNGRDLTGRTIRVGPAALENIIYMFTDRMTTIAGVLHDGAGRPVEGGTVMAFPTDRTLWSSTWIWSAAHTGQSVERGHFVVPVRGAGEYYVAGVPGVPSAVLPRLGDPAVLEALVPSARVIRVGEGQQMTADLIVAPKTTGLP